MRDTSVGGKGRREREEWEMNWLRRRMEECEGREGERREYIFGKEVRRARNKEWNGCRRVDERKRSDDEMEIKER